MMRGLAHLLNFVLCLFVICDELSHARMFAGLKYFFKDICYPISY